MLVEPRTDRQISGIKHNECSIESIVNSQAFRKEKIDFPNPNFRVLVKQIAQKIQILSPDNEGFDRIQLPRSPAYVKDSSWAYRWDSELWWIVERKRSPGNPTDLRLID
ncbi:predicted protein [Sclerotinia sclerotiorum 1980 UF-70]|uniref:Uncharacterized protein n=1 Tax=Sclerotinia sclerotiorum (strain ATCC 18683 / 1980 / Ss-1) TaxID=665079 RepID=A7EUP3_SCLS1|nr:predicted protein [Sclerotinia sclerotiorum 1980 UF-70]EDN93185.1 predicted protein [Sclerotinia sclerotiorum 1980 UF-70]